MRLCATTTTDGQWRKDGREVLHTLGVPNMIGAMSGSSTVRIGGRENQTAQQKSLVKSAVKN